jgi:hypothetical protein
MNSIRTVAGAKGVATPLALIEALDKPSYKTGSQLFRSTKEQIPPKLLAPHKPAGEPVFPTRLSEVVASEVHSVIEDEAAETLDFELKRTLPCKRA